MWIFQSLRTLFVHGFLKEHEWEYEADKRYIYTLLWIVGKTTYTRVFSSSVPLHVGNTIALADKKSFVVQHVSHVVYPAKILPKIKRPTTFVHSGISPAPETIITDDDITTLGFMTQVERHFLH